MSTAPGTVVEHIDDLVMAVAQGDQQAFASLYDHTVGAVTDAVRVTADDAATAGRAVERTWLRVWREAPTFMSGQVATGQRALSWILGLASSSPSNPQPQHGGGVGADCVQRALNTLTPVQRQALALARHGGLNRSEIADSLGVPEHEVSRALRDGLISLRDRLPSKDRP